MPKEHKVKKDGQEFTVREQQHDEQRFTAKGEPLPVRTLFIVFQGDKRITHSDSLEGLLKAGYEIEVPARNESPDPSEAASDVVDAEVDEAKEPAPTA